jgi:hypothetical protein
MPGEQHEFQPSYPLLPKVDHETAQEVVDGFATRGWLEFVATNLTTMEEENPDIAGLICQFGRIVAHGSEEEFAKAVLSGIFVYNCLTAQENINRMREQ